jgi:hypothetical protein
VRFINNAYSRGSKGNESVIQGAQVDRPDKPITIENYGDKETRPINAYVMFIIKY